MEKHLNRYGSTYTFKKDKEYNVIWEGDFKWCRLGVSNDYTAAYAAYLEVEGIHDRTLSLEQFKKEVHYYDELKGEHKYLQYVKLITLDAKKINMVDPSGGPYICVGTDLGLFGKSLKGLIVKSIEPIEKGYKLIT